MKLEDLPTQREDRHHLFDIILPIQKPRNARCAFDRLNELNSRHHFIEQRLRLIEIEKAQALDAGARDGEHAAIRIFAKIDARLREHMSRARSPPVRLIGAPLLDEKRLSFVATFIGDVNRLTFAQSISPR